MKKRSIAARGLSRPSMCHQMLQGNHSRVAIGLNSAFQDLAADGWTKLTFSIGFYNQKSFEGMQPVAKSFMSLALKAMKAAERDRQRQIKANIRDNNAAHRENVRAAKAFEADLKRTVIADERDRKAHEKELKAAHAASQMAEVDRLNSHIAEVFDELQGLLQATIDVDDYVDLESLRKSESSTPFDMPELEIPLRRPMTPKFPAEPRYLEPAKPTGFFGKKRKLEEARNRAQESYEIAKRKWEQDVAALQLKYEADTAAYEDEEAKRVEHLAREKARFINDLQIHNKSIDQFISNLSYGDAAAVQEYISLVVENSTYPDHFEVSHEFSFDPETAELRMKVTIPPPSDFPSIKAYSYVKASDEIREILLPKAEFKDRYSSAIYQVSIRSLHEVFEADRRGLIKTISLEVGTTDRHPATGKTGFITFVGVSAERESFVEFDLSGLVPLATLKHLGAAISKDPVNLVAVDVLGVRKS